MDEALFSRHKAQIRKRSESKKEIIAIIGKETGVFLKEEEVAVSKKRVAISTSSTKRQKLFQLKIKEALQEKGFFLQSGL